MVEFDVESVVDDADVEVGVVVVVAVVEDEEVAGRKKKKEEVNHSWSYCLAFPWSKD